VLAGTDIASKISPAAKAEPFSVVAVARLIEDCTKYGILPLLLIPLAETNSPVCVAIF